MHADRQRRYRERLKMQKVTHKGSKQIYRRALLERARKPSLAKPPLDRKIDSRFRCCCFCGKTPSRFLRPDSLQAFVSANITECPARVSMRSTTPADSRPQSLPPPHSAVYLSTKAAYHQQSRQNQVVAHPPDRYHD